MDGQLDKWMTRWMDKWMDDGWYKRKTGRWADEN